MKKRYIAAIGGGLLATAGTLAWVGRYAIADRIIASVFRPIEDDEPDDQMFYTQQDHNFLNEPDWQTGSNDISMPTTFRCDNQFHRHLVPESLLLCRDTVRTDNPTSPLTGNPLPLNDD